MASTYTVQRSIEIKAPPQRVFELVNTLEQWQKWSPWEGLDDNIGRTYTGPKQGVGSKYAWKGNRKVGEGDMTIVESDEPNKITIDLNFIKPFKSESQSAFQLEGSEATTVTWTMHGNHSWFTKLFFNMDKMIGPDFEKGLAQLKAAAEN